VRTRHWFVGMVVWAAATAALAQAGGLDDLKGLYKAREFSGKDGGKLLVRLMQPKDYDAKQKYPLVLVLHGAGGRGDDNWGQIKDQPLPFQQLASDEMRAKHPCFVVAPQCPRGKQWVNWPWGKGSYSQDAVVVSPELKRTLEVLDAVVKEFSIDGDRVVVTGLSMGGYGCWDIILREPTRFAAAVPICGAGDPSRAATVQHVAVWAFHGDKDGVVPVRGSREMVAALRKAGGEPRYHELPGVGHFAWIPAYKTPGLWDWVFAQRRTPAS